jgi:hypothetical protein
MRAWIILLVIVLLPLHLQAQNQYTAPVIFARETIRITPSEEEVLQNPASAQEGEKASAPPEPRPITQVSTEIRSQEALSLEYIHPLNTLTPTTGVMIALDSPLMMPLPRFNVYAASDVLFIDENGTILQILPNHIPAQVTQEILAPRAVKAFLYLQAGMVESNQIRPRDRISASIFTAPLPMMQ